jgi:predicted aspartyl protease
MITDAGMYLQGSVHGTGVKFLIDTGATVTMIAKGVYERMAPEDRPWLYEVTGNVLCADGKPLEVVGKGNLPCHSGEHVKSTAL